MDLGISLTGDLRPEGDESLRGVARDAGHMALGSELVASGYCDQVAHTSDLKQQKLIFSEIWRKPQIKVWTGLRSLWNLQRRISPCLFWPLVLPALLGTLGLWLCHSDLSLHGHMISQLFVLMSKISPFIKTSILDQGSTLLQYDLVLNNYICIDLVSKYDHILRYRRLGLPYIFGGNSSTHNRMISSCPVPCFQGDRDEKLTHSSFPSFHPLALLQCAPNISVCYCGKTLTAGCGPH